MAEAIETEELTVELGRRVVLEPISLRLRFGEVVAVLGPNGAGKSTLLRALAGLITHGGDIRIDGVPSAALSARERAQRVSFVPQQSQLAAALTVREVVALGRYAHEPVGRGQRREHETAIAQALTACELDALRARSYLDLSVGEQRRVLLARALASGARTLLLDEPSAALDIAHSLRLFAHLRALAAAGHAVLLVLHQLEHALELADRCLLLLPGGRLLAEGPTREVVDAARVRTLYGVDLLHGAAPGFRLPERTS